MDGVAIVVGAEFPSVASILVSAPESLSSTAHPSFDMWYRALGWYWFMTGVMLLWITPNVAQRTEWFRLIHIAFMAVGIATFLTLLESGTNEHLRYGNLVPELGVPLLAMAWQRSVARQAISD